MGAVPRCLRRAPSPCRRVRRIRGPRRQARARPRRWWAGCRRRPRRTGPWRAHRVGVARGGGHRADWLTASVPAVSASSRYRGRAPGSLSGRKRTPPVSSRPRGASTASMIRCSWAGPPGSRFPWHGTTPATRWGEGEAASVQRLTLAGFAAVRVEHRRPHDGLHPEQVRARRRCGNRPARHGRPPPTRPPRAAPTSRPTRRSISPSGVATASRPSTPTSPRSSASRIAGNGAPGAPPLTREVSCRTHPRGALPPPRGLWAGEGGAVAPAR